MDASSQLFCSPGQGIPERHESPELACRGLQVQAQQAERVTSFNGRWGTGFYDADAGARRLPLPHYWPPGPLTSTWGINDLQCLLGVFLFEVWETHPPSGGLKEAPECL